MILNNPETEIFVLFYESVAGKIYCNLHAKNLDAKWLMNNFNAEGTKEKVFFELPNKTLAEAEIEVVGEVRKKMMGS